VIPVALSRAAKSTNGSGGLASTLAHGQEEHRPPTGGGYNSMVTAAINSLVRAAPLISSMAAALINSKNSAAAVSRNTPAADTMMAAYAASSTAVAAINTHITAADISIVIPPVENGQSRVTVFLKQNPDICRFRDQRREAP
jgi:hypothetical protein